jgi:hypothetical protein
VFLIILRVRRCSPAKNEVASCWLATVSQDTSYALND